MGGGYICSIGAIASRDGQSILTASAAVVRIYSSATAALVFELKGHTGDVTALALSPHGSRKVYSASIDGTVRLWDIKEGTLLKTFTVGAPIKSMVVPSVGMHAFLSVAHAGGQKHGRVLSLNLATGSLEKHVHRTSAARPLTVSPGGSYVATFDKHTLLIWSTKEAEKRPLALHHTKAFTCVAIDAAEDRIAAGDVSGRINMWNSFGPAVAAAATAASDDRDAADVAAPSGQQPGQKRKSRDVKDAGLAKETLHWHSSAVRSLVFSQDGAYLLSGGAEAVLVIWRLDNGARTYLPRMAGALTAINPVPSDAACYILTQADNTIRMVNVAAMRVLCSVHGLRPRVAGTPSGTVAALVPGSGELALAGAGSVLQFFDTLRDRHIDRVQVGHRNVASHAGTDGAAVGMEGAVQSHISHIAFSGDGSVMATVDVHPSAAASGPMGSALKFWDRRVTGAAAGGAPLYSLNSHISEPQSGLVTGLAYNPSEHVAATVGKDGVLSIWRRASSKHSDKAPAAWRCTSTASYKGQPMSAVAFSEDGSLIATAVAGSVTLWDPSSNTLIAALANPATARSCAMWRLDFVPGTPYLVGICSDSSPSMVVWNLLTASVWWSAAVAASCLAVDPHHGAFAIAVPPEPPRRWTGSAAPGALPERGSPPAAPGKDYPTTNGLPDTAVPRTPESALPNGPQTNGRRSGAAADRPYMNGTAAADGRAEAQKEAEEAGTAQRGSDAVGQLEASAACSGGAVWFEEAEGAGGERALVHVGQGTAAELASSRGDSVYGGGGGSVLLFDAGSPTPKRAWLLPRSGAAALMFAREGTPLGAASPLLILTDDRQYTIAPAHGNDGAERVEESTTEPTAGASKGVVGYEAAFGPLKTTHKGGKAGGQEQPQVTLAEAQISIQELWDAPSHALPPLSVLAGPSLEAMLSSLAH
ncbi:g11764 [Coccomyxa elongata]